MPDELEAEFEVVRRLKRLSARFRTGYRKQHPITEKHREAVREAIGKDWEQAQKGQHQQTTGAANAQGKKQQEQEAQEKKQSKRESHGH